MLHTMLRGDMPPGPVPNAVEQTTILPALGDTLDLPDADPRLPVGSPARFLLTGPDDAATGHLVDAVESGVPSSKPPATPDDVESPPGYSLAQPRSSAESTEPVSAQWSWFTPATPQSVEPEPIRLGESSTYLHDPRDIAFLERLLQRLRRL
jgi:hypothetical protein